MPREPRFSGTFASVAARGVAMGLLLVAALCLAANQVEPLERRVSWQGVSFVLPGGFVPRGVQNGEMAVFLDRLRVEREFYVFRLRAQPGSAGEAEVEHPALESKPEASPATRSIAYPSTEEILRFMFPRLLNVLPLGPTADVEVGVRLRQDGRDVPFAAWVGFREEAQTLRGRATRTLYAVMVTTDGAGSYAILALRDPAYQQDQLEDRVEVSLELLSRTLETLEFRGSLAHPTAARTP